MVEKNFLESFEDRKNECLSKCEEWCKKERNPLDDLQYRIKDPIKAWHNHCAVWALWKIFDQIIHQWVYKWTKQLGINLYGDPEYHDLYLFVNGSHLFSAVKKEERCSVSPQELERAGYREGDEVWYWSTPEETWKYMFGRAGYCIIRNGMIIWSMLTEMN